MKLKSASLDARHKWADYPNAMLRHKAARTIADPGIADPESRRVACRAFRIVPMTGSESRAYWRKTGQHCQEWHWCALPAGHGIDCHPERSGGYALTIEALLTPEQRKWSEHNRAKYISPSYER